MVRYRNYHVNATNNEVKPGLELVNTGTTSVDLASVELRYYFTRDSGSTTFNTWCDWAQLDCGRITLAVRSISPALPTADRYLEVRFTSGTLAPGDSTGDIQLRFAKSDWSPMDETNDYSGGSNTTYVDSSKVDAFVNGTRVWGTGPPS
jgi:cellulose 1,4-beta-cellobiosidase